MARLAAGISTGTQVCEALGLDGQMVQRVTLVFDVDEVVRAYVRRLVTEDEVGQLKRVLERYVFKAYD